jgi:16S rRNA (uracil1498-N3)-methyltransferase
VFVEGATLGGAIELPPDEVQKLRKVLRLSSGSEVAVLPNDGSLLRCVLDGHRVRPEEQFWPDSESPICVTVAQSLPKGDKLEEIVRACTELGVSRFVLFNSDRTVVRWDQQKVADKLRRLAAIAREACEVSFRTQLPTITWADSLGSVLEATPEALVLSEYEGVARVLPIGATDPCIVVGPEGGWSSPEHSLIGDRAVTLGPRVLRVDHAAPAAAALLLLQR